MKKQIIFGLVVISILTVAFAVALIFTGKPKQHEPAKQLPPLATRIATVGGCDSKGLCGITLTDGTYGKAMYPVAGLVIKPEPAAKHGN